MQICNPALELQMVNKHTSEFRKYCFGSSIAQSNPVLSSLSRLLLSNSAQCCPSPVLSCLILNCSILSNPNPILPNFVHLSNTVQPAQPLWTVFTDYFSFSLYFKNCLSFKLIGQKYFLDNCCLHWNYQGKIP